MRSILLLFVLFCTIRGQISHIPGQSCHSAFTKSQVVGGVGNKAENVPWNAVFEKRSAENTDKIKTHCGGSVISNRVVLSAAHCFWANNFGCPQYALNQQTASECHKLPNGCPAGCLRVRPEDINIYVGITYVTQADRIPRTIKQIILHEGWDKSSSVVETITKGNDLALIVLERKLEFGPKIRPICIPDQQLRLQSGAYVEINGFGYIDAYNKILAERLQTGYMQIKARDDCGAEWVGIFTTTNGRIQGNQMCAYAKGTDSCKGDSGSGLVKRVDSVPVLVGIVSFGHKYCTTFPGVYTNIQTHTEWILEKLNMINPQIPQTFRRCLENETCETKATCTYVQQKLKEAKEVGPKSQRRSIINKLRSIICNKRKRAYCCPAQ